MQNNRTLPLFAGAEEASKDYTNFVFDGMPIKVIAKDGDPWFVLSDACRILGYSDSAQAARILDDDEVCTLRNMQGITRSKNGIVKITNESGLFSLILKSRKEEARKFKKWVTSEVLPQIRKTGSYGERAVSVNDLLANPTQLLAITQGYALQIEDLKREKIEMKKDVDALDRIAKSEGQFGLRQTAQILQMQERKLVDWLMLNRWCFRHTGSHVLMAYAEKRRMGYVTHKITTFEKGDGTEGTRETLKFLPAGIARLSSLLNVVITDGDLHHKDGA